MMSRLSIPTQGLSASTREVPPWLEGSLFALGLFVARFVAPLLVETTRFTPSLAYIGLMTVWTFFWSMGCSAWRDSGVRVQHFRLAIAAAIGVTVIVAAITGYFGPPF